MAKIKSNDRMPAPSRANLDAMMREIQTWKSPHRRVALALVDIYGEEEVFRTLHAMRRWYSGQTMARLLLASLAILEEAMCLEPDDALGVFRGFKVPISSLGDVVEGDTLRLNVTRNHGFSSWSLTEAPVHRFSGGGRGKVGLVVRLIDVESLTPVLAPPTHTSPWFNALYDRVIGRSFRPTEEEFLIAGSPVVVEVVRIKR